MGFHRADGKTRDLRGFRVAEAGRVTQHHAGAFLFAQLRQGPVKIDPLAPGSGGVLVSPGSAVSPSVRRCVARALRAPIRNSL